MTDSKTPFNNPFGAVKLDALRDTLPAAPAPAAPVAPAPVQLGGKAGKTIGGKTYARAVVRMERAGRGGKEATVIEQLELTSTERENWLKALKSALGCGGSIEGDTLMLQGDQRERLVKLLAERGVKKVTVG